MGIVSSLFGLFLPRKRTPMYYNPTRRTQMYSPQNRFRTNSSFRPRSIRIQPSQVQLNRIPLQAKGFPLQAKGFPLQAKGFPLQARRSFAPVPMVQPRKPGLFDGMFSTSFSVQRNQNIRKRQNSVQGFFARQRKNAFMSSMISGLRR
ncbi:MAG: hypothetical protein WC821_05580 [archaeon]